MKYEVYLFQPPVLQNKIGTLSLNIAGEEAGSFTIAFIFFFNCILLSLFFTFLFSFFHSYSSIFIFILIQVSGRLDWLAPFPLLSAES